MRPLHAVLATASALSFSAAAQTAPDVEDLVGARAAGGETQLLSRGYEARQSNVVRDQRFTFWWNARTGRCISVSTMDGRYAAITAVPAPNCEGGDASQPMPPSPPRAGARDAQSLVLVCYGAGSRPTVTSEPSYSWDGERHKWKESSNLRSGTQGFNSDVQIELYGDHGRIHLGPDLVPPIHSGGHNGWWDLTDLAVTPDRISARYRLNGMNRPQLTVDRRSGHITIDAMTDFSGQCDIGDWGAGTRRF